jgi:hypothetical protein
MVTNDCIDCGWILKYCVTVTVALAVAGLVLAPGYVPSPVTVTWPMDAVGVACGTTTVTDICWLPGEVNGMVDGDTVVAQPVEVVASSETMTVPTAGGLDTVTDAEKVADPMLLGVTVTSLDWGFKLVMVSVGLRCIPWPKALGAQASSMVDNINADITIAERPVTRDMVLTVFLRIFPSYWLIAI